MMLPGGVKVLVANEPVDFRKTFDGLCGVVRTVLKEDPQSASLFVFRNRRGDQLRVLWWDRNGFAIWMKKQDSVCPHSFVFTEIGGLAQNLPCRPAAVGGMD